MKNTNAAPSIRPAAKITTEAVTAKFSKKSQTARASFCRHGHWMGLVPIKLPTGGLLWDEAEADALLAGLPVKADPEKIDEHFKRKASDASKRPAHIVRKAEAKAKRLTTGEVAK
jgi:hypothetical protein